MDPVPDLTIVLLGNSGVGKSASGNTILGREEFESKRSFKAVTTQICDKTKTVFGKQIRVVDTPGIFGSEEQIGTWCQEHLQSGRPCLFLVVVKIDRFTTEQKNAVEAALRVIGGQKNNTFLLFSSGDALDNSSLDDFINDDPEGPLLPVVKSFERRYHAFNNKDGGQQQVRELLEKSGHLRVETSTRAELSPPSVQTRSHRASEIDPGELVRRRMVLLGLPGGGKSSSGNTILGSDQFEPGCDFDPVTTETGSKSAVVEGRSVTVVDTPGITNEVLTPKKLFLEIKKSIAEGGPGPHAFMIVVRIGRITKADVTLFQLVPKLLGSDAAKYAMVLFTHGDGLKKKSIEELINTNKHVSDLVTLCGGRFCVLDNNQRGNRQQVRELLGKIDKMVAASGTEHYTSEMFKKAQTGQMYLYVKWEDVREWFERLLKEIEELRKEDFKFWGKKKKECEMARISA
ncbi:GTPase IMAP family member 8-like [Centropristis striata]|uniref:GTPase IMAP family member 8-like n=1 Tax=Centropristis striata TaxID=184440 RepID=UPI0027E1D63A|nr:GTPase IMAP family member 8-like [Centropristis striata]